MINFLTQRGAARIHRCWLLGLLLVGLVHLAQAQAPAWAGASLSSTTQANGTSFAQAVATDESGNVVVAGYFTGSVAFGTTLLTSRGLTDLFVAKYVPATGTWAWAQRGGGTGADRGLGVAVSGGSVYVTGYVTNNAANANGVLFGDNVRQSGASSTSGLDVVLAKYTDSGASATLGWTQVGGGTGDDQGLGVAASGGSVYVTGYLTNSTTNPNSVLFGGTGTTAGTVRQNGASSANGTDLLLAKYTDNGASATLGWTQVGGGNSDDQGTGVAVSGGSVYVTGFVTNTTANDYRVVFGGTGTTAGTLRQSGASSNAVPDLVLAKYTDNGASATLGWTQVGGGTGYDQGTGVAVSGSSVYVTGYLTNTTANGSSVVFGGTGTTAGTARQSGASSTSGLDVVLAKYTDSGASATLGWTQVGGGTGDDQGLGVAASGGSVYVTGYLTNSTTNRNSVVFGGTGTTAGTVPVNGTTTNALPDLVLAKYTDNGASADLGWTQVGGSSGADRGQAIALSGSSVYVAGYVSPSGENYVFGPASAAPLGGTLDSRAVLAQATDAGGTGNWQALAAAFNGGTSQTRAVATDAAGNVFVTGSFTGQVAFGTTRLSSTQTGADLFVAKYVPATDTWAWAQSGGGNGEDTGLGVAVSGGSVYVTGSFYNTAANAYGVVFGSTEATPGTVRVNGASSIASLDLVLAKYADNGPSATLTWLQVGGGTGDDQGTGVAVSGSSVYVTGYISNSAANARNVLLGGTATTAGTVPVSGASSMSRADLLLAKYTDNGASASVNWTQVGGGTGDDQGQAIAVSGNSVYVTGYITNTTTNGSSVVFGGMGTTAGTVRQNGASSTSSTDVVLAKYTDNGASATLGWTQVGGGTGYDQGNGVAVSGSSVYVTGYLTNTTADDYRVVFGGTGTTAGTARQNGASASISFGQDLLLAKYTDNGPSATLGWTQVGGGNGYERGNGVAVSGNSVYVTGYIENSATNSNSVVFGGTGTTAGTVPVNGVSSTASADVVLAKYTDNGASATLGWTQVGGGTGEDIGQAVVLSGPSVLVVGSITPPASFGSFAIAGPVRSTHNVLARLVDNTLSTLPVVLTAFTATASGPAAVRLAWATASEVTSARFEVERSLDGVAFTKIGTVAAAGTSALPRTYALPDAALPAGASRLYYRLRQVDQDGTAAYSPVRSVALAGASTGLSLYPNPAPGGAATLLGAGPGAAVQVLDALGRPVATATADAAGTAALRLPAGLPAGVYVVRTGSQAVRLTVK